MDAEGAWGLRDGVPTWFSNLPMPSFFICSMRCRFCCWIHGVWDGAVEVSDGWQNLSKFVFVVGFVVGARSMGIDGV